VPSRRRQIIRSFHFPLIVANTVTRSDGSQSKRGAFDFITTFSESRPGRSHPLGAVTSTLTSSFFHVRGIIRLTAVCDSGASSSNGIHRCCRLMSMPLKIAFCVTQWEIERKDRTDSSPFLSMPTRRQFVSSHKQNFVLWISAPECDI
jgi:hypothetical protein